MEATFMAHEEVADIAVHAVPSKLGEDDVKVTAVLKPGSTLTPEQLCLWAVHRLPYFAIPLYIEFRTELPRNPLGKIMKYQLRDEGITAGTWDREKAGFEIRKR
jgi:crotonobetaine/carnitine-CoA ligase